ncbi:MAG: ABC transporter permease [Candidatus Tectomicrobia bacterium]|nr:ABC transporter permease [Candidatus Tectomicrobia bacterium]
MLNLVAPVQTHRWLQLVPAGVIVGFFGAWELIQRLVGYPPDFIAPLPSSVLIFTARNWRFLLWHLAVTLAEAGAGFALGNLLAVGLAIASVYNAEIERAIMPFALAIRSIPLIAITPVLIFLLGVGWESKVAVAVLVSFFPTLVNMIVGLRSVDHRLLELMHVLNASWWQILIRVRIPSAWPSFFAALKIAVPSSILGAAVAEWINASAGIGYLIIISTYQFNTVQLYTTMFITTIVSALVYLAVVWLENQLLPWRKYL